MGAKAWFIAYYDDDPKAVLADGPVLDRDASRALAEQLFPGRTLTEEADGSLAFLDPPEDSVVLAGSYGGLRIVAHEELGIDHPSRIDRRWFDLALGRTAYMHATHSVVDWFAFQLWRNGKLVRLLSVSGGLIEQNGAPLPFEVPFWHGRHPVTYDGEPPTDALPFHPIELAETSLLEHLGFQFEGQTSDWVCEPMEVPIATFSIR